MKNIYAILPCYNEEDNIQKLIKEWEKQVEDLKNKGYNLKIIGIDDCSKDKTKSKIIECTKKFDNVNLIAHSENRGLRGGINTAIHYFNKNASKEDLLVLMDGDNTHNPKYVHHMVELIAQGNDCVIASRYQEGSSIVGLSKNRESMSNFAKIYYSAILKIPNVKDYTCGYRVYTYDIIEKLLNKYGENPIKEKSFACMMELLYKVYKVGAKFAEVGFELRYDNKFGESKMDVLKTARRSLITAIKLKFNATGIFIMLFILLFSIFLSLGTNYSPTNLNVINHDCGIFSYIAYAMKEGRTLYVEAWENKGPLLYVIYYIGFLINEPYGLYLLELISIFISVLFSYKTINLITGKKIYSVLGTIFTFSTWGIVFESGTFSESFALPIIFVGVYLFTKQFLTEYNVKNRVIILWGILTALIAMLRLNMLSIFLGFFIIIAVDVFARKKIKDIFRWLGFGLLGFIIGITPMLIYLISEGALSECMNTAYFNILSGFNSGDTLDKFVTLMKMLLTINITGVTYIIIGFLVISIALIIKRTIVKKSWIMYILGTVLATIINLYANSVSGAYHLHYMITFIPVICMITALCLKFYDKQDLKYDVKVYFLSIIIILTSVISYKNYIVYCNEISNKVAENSLYLKIEQYILNETQETDLVQLIGGRMESVSANYRTKRLSASKYSYLPLWDTFTRERKAIMTNELIEDLKQNVPELIFICHNENNEKEFNDLIEDKKGWNEFIENNYIKDVETIQYYTIYKKR